jgi:hypothetical protein
MNDTQHSIAFASEVLGAPLAEWVEERRTAGQSWDRVSRELARATEGKCKFSRELLRRHFNHIPREVPVDSADELQDGAA